MLSCDESTLNRVLHVISYVKSFSAPRKTKIAGHAQNGLEIAFSVSSFTNGPRSKRFTWGKCMFVLCRDSSCIYLCIYAYV